MSKAPDGLLDASKVLVRNHYVPVTTTQLVEVRVPVAGAVGVLHGTAVLESTAKPEQRPPAPGEWVPTAENLGCSCDWDVQQDAKGFYGTTSIDAWVDTPFGRIHHAGVVAPKRVEILDRLAKDVQPIRWSLEARIEAVTDLAGFAAARPGISIYGKKNGGFTLSYERRLVGGNGNAVWGVGYAHRFGRR
jgi:hypothetical protein